MQRLESICARLNCRLPSLRAVTTAPYLAVACLYAPGYSKSCHWRNDSTFTDACKFSEHESSPGKFSRLLSKKCNVYLANKNILYNSNSRACGSVLCDLIVRSRPVFYS